MAARAQAFLATLGDAQRAKVQFPFDSEERFNWHFVPLARAGLSLKEMNAGQRDAAFALLRAGLSEKGYSKAEAIRALEPVLAAIEQNPVRRDPDLYYVNIFGEPSTTSTWGWRYEGHHLSQNWTIVRGEAVATTPQFLGSNPAEVLSGPGKGTRVLGAEEDLARALVTTLSAAQQAEAVIARDAPDDILTGNARRAAIEGHRGIRYGGLTPDQQRMLLALVDEHAAAQHEVLAQQRLDRIRAAGLDRVVFAWMGGLARGERHYYRVQGPTFLIEYDNTQNGANHIHTVWRELRGDFGEDLLAAHYATSPHHRHAN
jgi:hypothetical protein